MNQPTLIDVPEAIAPTYWNDKATSLSYDEPQIIRWIMLLHNNGNAFDVDPTYSKGVFWRDLPKPKYKFDLAPQIDGVEQADARALPLANSSVDSIMFDPPFVIKNVARVGGTLGKIEARFSGYKSVPELWQFYHDALTEFWRVLRPGGMVAFKCQDIVSSGRNWMTHARVISQAEDLGYYVKDLFVLARKNVLWSPNMANQQHARKNHCYFLVLVKP